MSSVPNQITIDGVDFIRKGSEAPPMPDKPTPWVMGQKYFIRTVTHHYVGRLVHVDDRCVMLDGCSWVADDGRFHVAMRDGKLAEVEPYPQGNVGLMLGSILDWCVWGHALPVVAI